MFTHLFIYVWLTYKIFLHLFQCVAEYFTEKAGNPYGVMSIDFSKSGSILFAGMDTGNVIGWDVPAGTEVGKSVILTKKIMKTTEYRHQMHSSQQLNSEKFFLIISVYYLSSLTMLIQLKIAPKSFLKAHFCGSICLGAA